MIIHEMLKLFIIIYIYIYIKQIRKTILWRIKWKKKKKQRKRKTIAAWNSHWWFGCRWRKQLVGWVTPSPILIASFQIQAGARLNLVHLSPLKRHLHRSLSIIHFCFSLQREIVHLTHTLSFPCISPKEFLSLLVGLSLSLHVSSLFCLNFSLSWMTF